MKNRVLFFTALLGLCSIFRITAQDFRATIINDSIVLENKLAAYSISEVVFGDGARNVGISRLIDKTNGINHCANYSLDAIWTTGGPDQIEIVMTELTSDTPERKSVLIETTNSTRVLTIFRDEPFLKIDYLKYDVNLVDYSISPLRKRVRYIYGEEKWKREKVLYEKCYYFQEDEWCHKQTGNGPDGYPSGLLYKDWLLLSLYDTVLNAGFGRVIYGPAIGIIKLLDDNDGGYEFFPYFNHNHHPYSSYIFPFSGGRETFYKTARQVAERSYIDKNPPQIESASIKESNLVSLLMNEKIRRNSLHISDFIISDDPGIKSLELSQGRREILIKTVKSLDSLKYKVSLENVSDDHGNIIKEWDKGSVVTINSSFEGLRATEKIVTEKPDRELRVTYSHPVPVLTIENPDAKGIVFGFEGGRVVKIGKEYHLFTSEMYQPPIWVKMRHGHWVSTDKINWRRVSTIMESSGEFEGKDPKAAIWSPLPVWDEMNNEWNLFYVAYKAMPNTPDSFLLNHEGRIWRAVSTVKGIDGIGGPYKDIGIILEPGPESQPWEGLQGTDSFFPWKCGERWYAFYGSAKTEMKPVAYWRVGIASAPELGGKWTRNADNPCGIEVKAIENPVVIPAPEKGFLAVYDHVTAPGVFGWTWSENGKDWIDGRTLMIDPYGKGWCVEVRTPLGLVDEGNGKYTMFFSGFGKLPDWEQFMAGKVKDDYCSIGYIELEFR